MGDGRVGYTNVERLLGTNSPPRSEKCCWAGNPPNGLGVSPAWVRSLVGFPDRTNSASEAPFQDRGAHRVGWVSTVRVT